MGWMNARSSLPSAHPLVLFLHSGRVATLHLVVFSMSHFMPDTCLPQMAHIFAQLYNRLTT